MTETAAPSCETGTGGPTLPGRVPAELVGDYSHEIELGEDSFVVNLLTGRSWRGAKADAPLALNAVAEFKAGEPASQFLADYQSQESAYFNSTRVSFVLIPTYSCNFSCSYCYEGKKTRETDTWTEADVAGVVEACSVLARREQSKMEAADFTFLGGEPLQPSVIGQIKLLIGSLRDAGAGCFSVVTNGWHLAETASDLASLGLSEVMVTLDGPPEVNNRRRVIKLANGSPFDRAMAGIAESLNCGLAVTVRVNIDQRNIPSLPSLAQIFSDAGFFDRPNFGSYLYPLSHDTHGGLYASEAEVARMLHETATEHPEIARFRWDLHGLSFLYAASVGARANPKLRYCGATAKQYVLDVHGGLYSCWFGAGHSDFSLGQINSADGKVDLNSKRLDDFRARSPLSMPECQSCKWALICGGGCTYKAVSRTGAVHSPNCAPFTEIFNLCGPHVVSAQHRGLAPS